MKKTISVLISLALLISFLPIQTFAMTGGGTESNPYLVSSASDINNIHNDLSGYYRLTCDIDMSGVEFEPIGNESEGAFTGTIDGNGYSIKNLNLDLPNNKYVGFIGYLGGTIKNLKVTKAYICGYRYIGSISAYMDESSNIDNCTNDGAIFDCLYYSNIEPYIGGICGYNSGGNINNCINNSNSIVFDGFRFHIGGIVSFNTGNVSKCINKSCIKYGYSIGGIVSDNHGYISECNNDGVLEKGQHIGGISGISRGIIKNCINNALIVGFSTTGGIAGVSESTDNCLNKGKIMSHGNVGGIVGEAGIISNCINTGDVLCNDITASYDSRICGISSNGTIYNCKNSGIIDSNGSNSRVAGISYSGNTYNCINTGHLKGKNIIDIGGRYNFKIRLSVCDVRKYESRKMTIELYEYDRDLIWSSSDNLIATVDSDGNVTGVNTGTAVITATTELGVSTSAVVTVNAPVSTDVSFEKNEISLEKGYSEKLIVNVVPFDAIDSIIYSSSNTSVASVSNDGIVTAKAQGSATITAETSNGKTAYCVVTVIAPTIAVSSVTLNKTSAVLTSADKIQLNATVLPENATDKSIIWKSSDEAIATVSNTGVVTAVSPGNATITATSNNGYYHECNIDVVAANGSAFIAKSTKASAGEIAEYTVSVVKNPGISSYKLNLDYDSSLLTPIEIVKNPQISGSLSSNLKDEERSTLNVIWYSTDDFTENADLFTIKFKVANNTEYGTEIPITMSSGASNIKNSSGKKLAFFMNNTSIKVEKPLLGDIFEDGEIDFRDLNLLARNVSGLESLSQRQLLAADTEQDKVIDTKDTVRLLQHLTGWTGADLIYTFAMNNSAASVNVGSASINAANEAEIPVSIEYNPGIAGFRFELDYDKNALDILSITPTAAISENFMTNLGTDEKLYVSWYNAENISTDGTLFTIKVKYKDGSDKQVTPISIVAADNNMCNQKREDVIAEYETGYLMTDSFVKENEAMENGTYSAELYFDNSYEEKSAVAILALYDKSGKLITLSSEDITVKPGKQNISVPLKTVEFDNFKLFIWDSLNTMQQLTRVK